MSSRHAGTLTCPHCDTESEGFMRDVDGDGAICSSCGRVF